MKATQFYPLPTPPRVLIFYSTKDRLSPEETVDGHKPDAEAEKDCLEKFFDERNIQPKVFKDPTAQQLFSAIEAAQTDSGLSGLVVFIMSHGEKGIVSVKGRPDYVPLQDVIIHMNRGPAVNKPKVDDTCLVVLMDVLELVVFPCRKLLHIITVGASNQSCFFLGFAGSGLSGCKQLNWFCYCCCCHM